LARPRGATRDKVEKTSLSAFRNFFIHNFFIKVLSWTSTGAYDLKPQVNSSTGEITYKIFPHQIRTEIHLNPNIYRVLMQRLRKADKLPDSPNPAKVYSNYITYPILPIVLLPKKSELAKSPQEVENFQDEDVRDFCTTNYEMTSKLLGTVYEFLIRVWKLRTARC
jgi:hypothetical protein